MKLSIIMPIYNTAKYLPYTLKSLTSQNYADVEFVCVDDCSTDDSWRILCETAKLDKRFRLIRQEYNQGVGAARKKAVDASLGKYIMFLDGDDALAENACERLVEEIERQHVDILQFGVETVYLDKSLENPDGAFKKYAIPENVMLEGDNLVDACFVEHKMLVNLWNKIYCGEIVRKAMNEYPQERLDMAQDQLTTFMLLFYARTCGALQEKLYIYNYGCGVTGKKSFTLKRMQTFGAHGKVLKQIDLFIDRHNAWERCGKARDTIRDTFVREVIWKLLKEAPQLDAPKGFDQMAPFFNSSDFMGGLATCISEWNIDIEDMVERVYGSETVLRRKRNTKNVALLYCGKLDSGARSSLEDWSNCMTRSGFNTVIMTDKSVANDAGLKKTVWFSLCPLGTESEGERISNFCEGIRKYRVDSVILFDWNCTSVLLEILSAKLEGANAFAVANDFIHIDSGYSGLRKIENGIQLSYVCRLADGILVPSERERVLWTQWNDNVYLIEDPAWKSTSSVEKKHSEKYILYYADAQEPNHVLVALKILKLVLAEDSDVKLQLVWETSNQRVKRWLDEETVGMGLEEAVEQSRLADEENRINIEALVLLRITSAEDNRRTSLYGLPVISVCAGENTYAEAPQCDQECNMKSAAKDILHILQGEDCSNGNKVVPLQSLDVQWKNIFDECKVYKNGAAEGQLRTAAEIELRSAFNELKDAENEICACQGQLKLQSEKFAEEKRCLEQQCKDLTEGKEWLEGQWKNLTEENKRLEQWCKEQAEGKDWLEEQWRNLLRENRELSNQRDALAVENEKYRKMSGWDHFKSMLKRE